MVMGLHSLMAAKFCAISMASIQELPSLRDTMSQPCAF